MRDALRRQELFRRQQIELRAGNPELGTQARPLPPVRLTLPGQFDSYEGPRSTDLQMRSMPSQSFRTSRDVGTAGWAPASGNPFAGSVKEAYPQLSLDPRAPDYVQQLKTLISSDIRAAYGREATEEDFNYWIPKFMGECDSGMVTSGQMSANDYWHRRLIGMGAGGNDVALFGPYAGGDGVSGAMRSWMSLLDPEDLARILQYLIAMGG